MTTPPAAPLCWLCDRFNPAKRSCAAFPAGVPEEIIAGKVDHREAVDGDNGLRFVPAPGTSQLDVAASLQYWGATDA